MAVPVLAPSDPILAIDLDPPFTSSESESSYPIAESPQNVLDGVAATKYLNFGEENSGFIVTPAAGSSTLRSFRLTTANDAPARDPAEWALHGTNDAIVSMDNSVGNGESWTLIATGTVTLPDARLTPGPVVPVANGTAYTSYRLLFTAVKNAALANSMQVADVGFFENMDGSGSNILAVGDLILAIDPDTMFVPESSSPLNEGPEQAIDGNSATKYLNFGEEKSGFIVTPLFGTSVVTDFVITTANDAISRDPATWALYGTNDPISSTNHSQGMGETWTLIDQGSLALPDARQTVGPTIPVSNSNAYTSYRLVFPTVKDSAAADSMQFSEIQFGGVAPTPTPTPSPTPTATSTSTSTPTATPTPSPTTTPTPTSPAVLEIPAASGLGLVLLGLLLGAASLAVLRRRG